MEEKVVRECPKCGNYVAGTAIDGDGRTFAKGLARGVASTVANSYIPGVSLVAGSVINKVTDSSVDMVMGERSYEFSCPKCGHVWNTLPSKTYPPEEQIEKHRQAKLSEMRPSLVGTMISLALSLSCLLYCVTHESSSERTVEGNIFTLGRDLTVTDYNFLWWILGFFFLVLGGITYVCFTFYLSQVEECDKIEAMSLHEYCDSYMR